MGYDVHITRRVNWFDGDGLDIALDEFMAVVDADGTLTAVDHFEAQLPDGTTLRMDAVGALYKGVHAFRWRDGNVTVKNPTEDVIAKMIAVASVLDAHLQGDEGESYPTQPTTRPPKK